jgi:hypothetical protein
VSEHTNLSKPAMLLLFRLLLPGKSKPTESALRKNVQAVTGPMPDDRWAGFVTELHAAGYVDRPVVTPMEPKRPPKKPKPPAPPKYGPPEATAAGRAAGLKLLDLETLPSKITWPKMVAELVFPMTVPATDRAAASDAKQLPAYLLASALKVRPAGKIDTVIERAVLADLGFPDAGGWPDVVRSVIGKRLGIDLPPMTPTELAKQVPRLVFPGVRDAKPAEIRKTRLREWASQAAPPTDGPVVVRLESGPDHTGQSLADFAIKARTLAAATTEGRFGRNKIFIARLWDHWTQDRPPLEKFKSMLVQAHQAGLLTLSRADLVSVMDPADVARSETKHLNAEFHFVLIEP